MNAEQIYSTLEEAYFGEHPHEAGELLILPELIGDAKIFVDVGASLGQYTRAANAIMQDSLIYAIEADPIRFRRLEVNCKSWEAKTTNRIIPLHAAASDKNGTIEFCVTGTSISGAIFELNELSQSWERVQVQQMLLDDLLVGQDAKKMFIKMDIEGAEYRALQGMRHVLSMHPQLLIELHAWGDPELRRYPEHSLALLAREGYKMRKTHAHFFFTIDKRASATQMYWQMLSFKTRRAIKTALKKLT